MEWYPSNDTFEINKCCVHGKIQLTLEQHRFELHQSTYVDFFPVVNTTVLHDPWLVESLGAELSIRRASYKGICEFSTAQGSLPLILLLFRGQLYCFFSQAQSFVFQAFHPVTCHFYLVFNLSKFYTFY